MPFALSTMPEFLDPNWLITTFGLIGILAIVFAESGLLIGFFLPGDSLLFTTGLLVADGEYLPYPLWLVCVLITVAAIAGDQVGYLFGRKVGPKLFRRPDARLFKQANLVRAHEFFDKYGARSIVLARFVPVVRTFTPIVAGVSRMSYRTFVIYNVVGAVLWGTGVTVLGFFLGQIPFVAANIELILVAIVAVSVLPIVVELAKARSGRRPPTASAPAPSASSLSVSSSSVSSSVSSSSVSAPAAPPSVSSSSVSASAAPPSASSSSVSAPAAPPVSASAPDPGEYPAKGPVKDPVKGPVKDPVKGPAAWGRARR